METDLIISVTRVDMMELRKQQIKLGMLRAGRVLLKHQNILRKILTQCVLPELLPAEVDTSTSDYDYPTESVDIPNMILQQVLMAATQPSPLKALFARDELEVCERVNIRILFYRFLPKTRQ